MFLHYIHTIQSGTRTLVKYLNTSPWKFMEHFHGPGRQRTRAEEKKNVPAGDCRFGNNVGIAMP